MRWIAGTSCAASGGFPISTLWSRDDPVGVVDNLGFVAELQYAFDERTADSQIRRFETVFTTIQSARPVEWRIGLDRHEYARPLLLNHDHSPAVQLF
jgi:hypothetical protein